MLEGIGRNPPKDVYAESFRHGSTSTSTRSSRTCGRSGRSLAKNVAILLTVKADAYGHGAVQVAQAADEWVDWYGVATLDEARELRKAEVRKRILILSPILEKEIPGVVDNGFATTVSSLEFAAALAAYAAKRSHESGGPRRDRHGNGQDRVLPGGSGSSRHANRRFRRSSSRRRVHPLPGVGYRSGFHPRSRRERFLAVGRAAQDRPVSKSRSIHSANSAALAAVPETHMQMVRPGLVAYGHLPAGIETSLRVRPVMSWKSRLVEIRRVAEGDAGELRPHVRHAARHADGGRAGGVRSRVPVPTLEQRAA